MPVKFNVMPRKDPRDQNSQPKFYATVKSSGRADTYAIAKSINSMSTVSSVDTAAVLEAFLNVVPDKLVEGRFPKRLSQLSSLPCFSSNHLRWFLKIISDDFLIRLRRFKKSPQIIFKFVSDNSTRPTGIQFYITGKFVSRRMFLLSDQQIKRLWMRLLPSLPRSQISAGRSKSRCGGDD